MTHPDDLDVSELDEAHEEAVFVRTLEPGARSRHERLLVSLDDEVIRLRAEIDLQSELLSSAAENIRVLRAGGEGSK